PDYAPAANIKCRVSYRNRLVRNKDGEEVTSSAQITTLAPVEIGDKLILDGRVFLAIDVSKPQTFSGQEHRRVVFV
ncbi:MAG TPA: hypothetical protein PKH23_00355, partial [Bacillota bacterium]|nr:hypothetical protein [Bacillota bacterium]